MCTGRCTMTPPLYQDLFDTSSHGKLLQKGLSLLHSFTPSTPTYLSFAVCFLSYRLHWTIPSIPRPLYDFSSSLFVPWFFPSKFLLCLLSLPQGVLFFVHTLSLPLPHPLPLPTPSSYWSFCFISTVLNLFQAVLLSFISISSIWLFLRVFVTPLPWSYVGVHLPIFLLPPSLFPSPYSLLNDSCNVHSLLSTASSPSLTLQPNSDNLSTLAIFVTQISRCLNDH